MPAMRYPTSPGPSDCHGHEGEAEDAGLLHLVRGAVPPEADGLPGLEPALVHAHVHDDAAVDIVVRVEDERLQRLFRVSLRRGHSLHDGLAQLVHARPQLSRHEQRAVRIQSQVVVDLLLHSFDVGAGQVDLVDHGDDLEVVLDGHVHVGEGLRLDTLAGVDEEHGSLAGGDGARNLVGEVDVPRGVHEVQHVFLPVFRLVGNGNRLALDGDAALALDVHVVEDLVVKIPIGYQARALDEAVRQRGLAVVDMGDDAEVS